MNMGSLTNSSVLSNDLIKERKIIKINVLLFQRGEFCCKSAYLEQNVHETRSSNGRDDCGQTMMRVQAKEIGENIKNMLRPILCCPKFGLELKCYETVTYSQYSHWGNSFE